MIFPTLKIEQQLWRQGYCYVCGLDEVGRGSFAGPVVVGAVIFPSPRFNRGKNVLLPKGIADSKLLSAKKREKLDDQIKQIALSWSVGEIGVRDINKFGIGKATQMAFRKALKNLSTKADFVLIDAFYVKHFNRKRQRPIKDGDKICASISAASIIAKVYRDKLMEKVSPKYPQYGFSKNKGYGTKEHQEAIKKHGLTRIHRKSFKLEKFLK